MLSSSWKAGEDEKGAEPRSSAREKGVPTGRPTETLESRTRESSFWEGGAARCRWGHYRRGASLVGNIFTLREGANPKIRGGRKDRT